MNFRDFNISKLLLPHFLVKNQLNILKIPSITKSAICIVVNCLGWCCIVEPARRSTHLKTRIAL